MRRYEVRVHLGRTAAELHWITAASDEAASDRAEQLMVDSADAVGVEVICAGERIHVRGLAPVATSPFGRSERLAPEQPSRLWSLMQRIERARHRAELSEAKAAKGSAVFRAEMTEVAQAWRDLVQHIETENAATNVAGPAPVGEAPPSSTASAEPSGRFGDLRQWLGIVVGMVIGALGALTLAAPRWIEASTGVDIDRRSGVLEWALTVIAPVAVIATAFALRTSPRRTLANIDRQGS